MKKLDINNLYEVLRNFVSMRYSLVCIGTELRNDDRAGLEICRRVLSRLNRRICIPVIECIYGLENCVDEIIEMKMNKMLIFDAIVSSELLPGDIVLLNIDELMDYDVLTTHYIPMNRILDIISNYIGKLQIAVIGINVKDLDIGFRLSDDIEKSVRIIVDALVEIISEVCYSKSKS